MEGADFTRYWALDLINFQMVEGIAKLAARAKFDDFFVGSVVNAERFDFVRTIARLIIRSRVAEEFFLPTRAFFLLAMV